MREKIKHFVKSIQGSTVLAVLFTVYIIYLGSSAVSGVVESSKSYFQQEESSGLNGYIEMINKQYEVMLADEKDVPVLLNNGTYIDFCGLMAKLLGQTEINGRFKLRDGVLIESSAKMTDEQLDLAFEQLCRLNDAQRQQGKYFVYVMAPSQMYESAELLPTGYTDGTEKQMDVFVQKLREAGIPVLDLREKLEQQGISHKEAFFTTDHHWKPETGFWAYGQIIRFLSEEGVLSGVDEFYLDEKNYTFDVYEKSFLGSSGKRTGRYFAGLDDFCAIAPAYDTEITIEIESANVLQTGCWEDVSYKGDIIESLENKDFYNDNPYGRYGWGDRGLTLWSNENAPEKRKVMMIGESFGNVPYSLMPLYMSECAELDMRHFRKDFETFYREYEADIVILLTNARAVTTVNATYDFFGEHDDEL